MPEGSPLARPGQGRRRLVARSVIGGIVLLAAAAGVHSGSAAAVEPAPQTIFYVDGPPASGPANGQAITLIAPADATADGHAVGDTPQNAIQFEFVTTDSLHRLFRLQIGAPFGQKLVPGSYSAGPDVPVEERAWLSVWTCFADRGSFEVLQADWNADGALAAFAATFTLPCSNDGPTTGEIRFNSAIPLVAREISELRLTFPIARAGEHAEAQSVTVHNTGSAPLALEPPTTTGPFEVTGSTCEESLPIAATCAISVTSNPTLPGPSRGRLIVNDSSIGTGHWVELLGSGFVDTVTTLTSSVNPSIWPDTPTELIATVTPAPDRGFVEFCRVDGGCGQIRNLDRNGVASLVINHPIPSEDLYAVFGGRPYYAESTSEVITQTSLRRPEIRVSASEMAVPIGHPVGVGAEIAFGDVDGGTLTLEDELTGRIVASQVQPAPALFDCLQMWEPGVHRIRASYTGNGGYVLPSTAFVDVLVAKDQPVQHGPGLNVTLYMGEPYCVSLMTPPTTSVYFVHDPIVTLEARASGLKTYTHVRVSNSGDIGPDWQLVHGKTFDYGVPFDWSLVDPANGREDADGQIELHYQLEDTEGVWTSGDFAAVWWLDRQPPSGDVDVADGASVVRSRNVVLDVSAADALSGPAAVELSNDGSSWTTRAYAPTQTWVLSSTSGTKTVWVRWRDAAGNLSAVKTDTIVLDTDAPSATAPARSLVAGSTVDAGKLPVRLTWSGADATSGVARYELAQSTDAAAYATVSSSLTTGAVTRALAPGHTYRFRTRAIDKAGNVGAWATAAAFTLSAAQESSLRLTWTGAWHAGSSTGYWGAADRYATAAGATAKVAVTGRSFAWIGAVGPSRGSARVYVDGVLVKTVSLYAPMSASRRVLFATTWATSATRTVVIIVVGTAGHPRVDLDAVAWAS
ncbi:MAG: hypothetical protein ACJ77B_06410 [Chloroflexota bacterium]